MVGQVGEAFWFATICAFGVLSLSTLVAWQVFSPETHLFSVGYGFWLLVLVSCFFIGIGSVGFFFRVVRVAYSDEHRNVMAKTALPIPLGMDEIEDDRGSPPMVPRLHAYTDSPGVKLAYRLPADRPEVRELVLGSIFVLAWDALVAAVVAVAFSRWLRGQFDLFVIALLLPAFGYIGFRVNRWFFRRFRIALGIGPTTLEIDHLPLRAGRAYRLLVVQYGRLALKKLSVSLVCDEVATYHWGTDTRTDRQEVWRTSVIDQGRSRIDWGRPLEIEGSVTVPTDAMHSFQSPHNAIQWKIVVEGEASRWPSYCRSFPVVVYPPEPHASASAPTSRA